MSRTLELLAEVRAIKDVIADLAIEVDFKYPAGSPRAAAHTALLEQLLAPLSELIDDGAEDLGVKRRAVATIFNYHQYRVRPGNAVTRMLRGEWPIDRAPWIGCMSVLLAEGGKMLDAPKICRLDAGHGGDHHFNLPRTYRRTRAMTCAR